MKQLKIKNVIKNPEFLDSEQAEKMIVYSEL